MSSAFIWLFPSQQFSKLGTLLKRQFIGLVVHNIPHLQHLQSLPHCCASLRVTLICTSHPCHTLQDTWRSTLNLWLLEVWGSSTLLALLKWYLHKSCARYVTSWPNSKQKTLKIYSLSGTARQGGCRKHIGRLLPSRFPPQLLCSSNMSISNLFFFLSIFDSFLYYFFSFWCGVFADFLNMLQ